MADLTPRQTEALAWLHRVGKASRRTLKRHGYSERTMRALVAAGVADAQHVHIGFTDAVIYRPRGGS